MITTSPISLTSSFSLGLNELESSLQKLIPDTLKPSPIEHQSEISDAERKETQLLEALRQGDEAAFSSLIDRYHTRLLRVARSYVSSEAIAEEVVQETWLGVLEGIHQFEGRSSLKTWIFRILTNRAKTRGQREHRYVSFTDAAPQGEDEDDRAMEPERFHTSGPRTGHWAVPPTTWDEQTPERLLSSKEGMTLLQQAIQALPANQRQIMIFRDIEGIDSEEICQSMNISATNQRVLLHRARTKVRSVLNQYIQGH